MRTSSIHVYDSKTWRKEVKILTIKTKAIILKIAETSGKSKLVYLLTEEMGFMTAFADLKNSVAKKSYAIDIFCYGELLLYKTASENYLINSFYPEQHFYNIREDILTLALAGYLSQLIIYLQKNSLEFEKELLSLLLNSLYLLSKDGQAVLGKVKAVFELKIAHYSGFAPLLYDECKAIDLDTYFFCYEDGSLSSKPVTEGERVSRAVVAAIIHVLKNQPSKAFSFKISAADMEIFFKVCEKYLLYHTEQSFSTLAFLKGLM